MAIVAGMLAREEQLFGKLEAALRASLDAPALDTEGVAAFPMAGLRDMFRQVSARGLWAISVRGALVGLFLGFFPAVSWSLRP